MGGRHKRETYLWRKVALIGLCLAAIVTLFYAFARPTRTVSSAVAIPVIEPHPESEVATLPTGRLSTSPTHHPTRTLKPSQRRTQSALRAAVEKDQLPPPTEPPPAPLILSQSSSAPKSPAARVAAPRSSLRKAAPPPVMKTTREAIEKQEDPPTKTPTKTSIKETPKPQVNSARPNPPSSQQVRPKAKAPTVVALPPVKLPVIPVVTNNTKCANIGLQATPRAACNTILAAFPQIKSVLGVGPRAGNPNSCHPKGLAIDFIVGTDKALGDRLFAFVTARRAALGASPVVLWQVPDHFDHVHVSFDPCKG